MPPARAWAVAMMDRWARAQGQRRSIQPGPDQFTAVTVALFQFDRTRCRALWRGKLGEGEQIGDAVHLPGHHSTGASRHIQPRRRRDRPGAWRTCESGRADWGRGRGASQNRSQTACQGPCRRARRSAPTRRPSFSGSKASWELLKWTKACHCSRVQDRCDRRRPDRATGAWSERDRRPGDR